MAKSKSRQAGAASDPPPQNSADTASGEPSADAITLLSNDHREVEKLFQQFEQADTPEEKQRIAKQVCDALNIHSTLEEELFYPACRAKGVEQDAMDEAQVEHDGAKVLIAELRQSAPSAEFYDAKMTVLTEYIKHHVGEEEKPGTGIFAQAKNGGVDLAELGKRIQARRSELQSPANGSSLAKPDFKSLTTQRNQSFQETSMNRQFNGPHRDEQGRFESEEDYRGERGRPGSRMNEAMDDDRYPNERQGRFSESGNYSRGERDWQNEGGPRGYLGRDEDYDSNRGGGYGDSDRYGASGTREDSEDYGGQDSYRGGGSQRGYGEGGRERYADDDRGYGDWPRSSQSQRGNEVYERAGSAGRGYGEGDYSQRTASQRGPWRGYEEEGNGGSGGRGRGWYGDSEGHSRASEEGWSHRGSSRGSSSREDDNRGTRSGGGGGSSRSASSSSGRGWHGDSQGHARASEEGWSHRGGSRNGHSRNGSSSRSHSR